VVVELDDVVSVFDSVDFVSDAGVDEAESLLESPVVEGLVAVPESPLLCVDPLVRLSVL
jgi:hypothetical protein